MSVGLGDQINYALDVTFYQLANKTFSIDYTNVFITDEKTGNDSAHPISVAAPSAEELKQLNGKKVITYSVSYTIRQEDVARGSVVNEAQLAYRYRSLHSAGQFATTSDAQAEIAVHSSVTYRYESGTEGMALPPELAALAPADYEDHQEGSCVTAAGHLQTTYWDGKNGGCWMLQNGGAWSGTQGGEVDPGDCFVMPGAPVTLRAVWAFFEAPTVDVEKNGSITGAPDGAAVQAGQTVRYTARYSISVRNTGNEALTQITIRDETLPEDPAAIDCAAGGTAAPSNRGSMTPMPIPLRCLCRRGSRRAGN